MARIRNQPEANNTDGNNQSPQHGNDRAVHSESLATKVSAEQN